MGKQVLDQAQKDSLGFIKLKRYQENISNLREISKFKRLAKYQ